MTVYSPQFSNSTNFVLKMWNTVVQACKLSKSLSKTPWGSSKEILLIYYFSSPDEGDGNKIYQFLSSQGGLSFYGSQKRDEGADTDLMFQFCLPYRLLSQQPLKSETFNVDRWNLIRFVPIIICWYVSENGL